MPWQQVTPVMLECEPGVLCGKRYRGHARGCPNFGKRQTCPPRATVWTPEFLHAYRWHAIWNVFDFGAHVARMKAKHPAWSQRQLECCLYWQGTARRQLTEEIRKFHEWKEQQGCGRYATSRIPEAHGVNVTATMAQIGIELEWPPKAVTYQVALACMQSE
jgi:predicted metal-binding protein